MSLRIGKSLPVKNPCFLILVIIIFILPLSVSMTLELGKHNEINHSIPYMNVIKDDIVAQDNHDWESFISLRSTEGGTPENRDDWVKVREINSQTDIMKNIISAKLKGIKELPLSLSSKLARIEHYLDLYSEIKTYYVAIDYRIRQEVRGIYNGINYRFYVLAPEGDRWVIVEASEAPLYRIIEAGYGFYTPEEERAVEAQIERISAGNSLEPYNPSRNEPNSIKVWRTQLGRIDTVDFNYYVRNVIPNEWAPNWPSRNFYSDHALRVGALACKMYGWYRVRGPAKYPGKGYDVRDDSWDQVYRPGSEYSYTNIALDEIRGIGANCNRGEVFETNYWNGRAMVYGTNGAALGIHQEPGINTPIIDLAYEGDGLIILSSGLITKDSHRWWLVKTGDIYEWSPGNYSVGWASGSYLRQRKINSDGSQIKPDNLKSINERFIGWLTQFGTKYWSDQGKDYGFMASYFWDNSPQTGCHSTRFFYYGTDKITVRIDEHSTDLKQLEVGKDVTLSLRFTNTSDILWTFGAAATLKKPDGNVLDFPVIPITLKPNQQGNAKWVYTVDMAGCWDVVFGVWENTSELPEKPLAHTGWLKRYITSIAYNPSGYKSTARLADGMR